MPNGETYKEALRAMQAKDDSITLLIGPPGTGKTRAAIEAALNKNMLIAVFRPAVSFGPKLGYLPGGIEDKLDPWVTNIKNILIDIGYMPDKLIDDGTVSFPSYEHMQGDTWHNTFIIFDECQNMPMNELYVALTRPGKKSRIALCGDFKQKSSRIKYSGINEIETMMRNHGKRMNVVDFENAKNYRSDLCNEVVTMFKEHNGDQL